MNSDTKFCCYSLHPTSSHGCFSNKFILSQNTYSQHIIRCQVTRLLCTLHCRKLSTWVCYAIHLKCNACNELNLKLLWSSTCYLALWRWCVSNPLECIQCIQVQAISITYKCLNCNREVNLFKNLISIRRKCLHYQLLTALTITIAGSGNLTCRMS